MLCSVFVNTYGLQYLLSLSPEQTLGGHLLSGSEDMGGVHTDGIDGTVMTSHLSNWHESIYIPEFQNATSAATKQNRMAWHHAQGTDPVLVCIWDLLKRVEKAENLRGTLQNQWSHQNWLQCF